jgi:hypothetical protein
MEGVDGWNLALVDIFAMILCMFCWKLYIRNILKSIESSIPVYASSFTKFSIIVCSSSDMMMQFNNTKLERLK